jgi:hypothetical protein
MARSSQAQAKKSEPDKNQEVLDSLEDVVVAIEHLSNLGESLLRKCRLKRRTLCMLIRDATANKVSIRQVNDVLDALPLLKQRFLKKGEYNAEAEKA